MTTTTDALADLPPPPVTAAARTVAAIKVYGSASTEIRALDGVTVAFARGRFTAIMGPSGSGKSTLMQTTAGLDRLRSGQAFIGDQDITRLNPTQLTILRREQIGFVLGILVGFLASLAPARHVSRIDLLQALQA